MHTDLQQTNFSLFSDVQMCTNQSNVHWEAERWAQKVTGVR